MKLILKNQCYLCYNFEKDTRHCIKGNDTWKLKNCGKIVDCEDWKPDKETLKYYKIVKNFTNHLKNIIKKEE